MRMTLLIKLGNINLISNRLSMVVIILINIYSVIIPLRDVCALTKRLVLVGRVNLTKRPHRVSRRQVINCD